MVLAFAIGFVAGLASGCGGVAFGQVATEAARGDGQDGALAPLGAESGRPELAPAMGGLQRLTHKLSLSIGAGNLTLARFYAYESVEVLRAIQREIPEYDGHPVAFLIDRLALPAYDELTEALRERPSPDREAGARTLSEPVDQAMGAVVAACNECHGATRHGFIRIRDERERNPFNQEFGSGELGP